MLDLFRARGITNVVYGVIIVATITVFVIQFRPNAGQKSASLNQACVANVRGWCVDPKDFSAAVRLLMPVGPQGEPNPAKAKQIKLKEVALEGLIERELLVGEAERLGITATEGEVTDMLYDGFIRVSVPADNPAIARQVNPRIRDGMVAVEFRDSKSKKFDMKIYERTVRNLTGRSPTEFREEQTRELIAAKVRDLVRAPIRVSEAEAFDAYMRTYNTATVSYVHVKQSFAAKYAVTVSDADVDIWSKEHQQDIDHEFDMRKEADLPKEGRIRHILAEFKSRKNATPEEKGEALAKISEAWARLKKGEPFAEVARQMSDDPGSKTRGGGYDSMEGFDPWFVKSVNALAPGKTTDGAIETQFGYHILEKDDPSQAAQLEPQIKKAIARELFMKTKAQDAAKEIAGKILDQMKQGKSADEAVKLAIMPLVKTTAIEPAKITQDPTPPAAPDAGAAATDGGAPSDASAGKPATAEKKEKPAPITMKAITAETDPDRPKVETSSAFPQGGDPFPGLTPDGTTAIIKFAFHSKDGEVMPEPARAMDGVYVVQLKEHHAATKEDFDKERDQELAQLLVAKQNEALAQYVKQLKETSKQEIKRDDTYLKEPSKDGGAGPQGAGEEEDEY